MSPKEQRKHIEFTKEMAIQQTELLSKILLTLKAIKKVIK
tara:strand:+ start:647 stop:766 length:120 start_codon:yes stop_codon:yes gene_type:complete